MQDTVRWTLLLDIYGSLLTDRQREALSLHLEEDLSYAEIAAELGISRQGAADAAGAARDQLRNYEDKLHLLDKHLRDRQAIARAIAALDNIADAQQARAILIKWMEDDDHGV